MGPAGTRIREECVAGNDACGILQQGYISSGTHPTLLNQRATLTVCFKTADSRSFKTNCQHCNWDENVEVINCGSYFVYDLPSIGEDDDLPPSRKNRDEFQEEEYQEYQEAPVGI